MFKFIKKYFGSKIRSEYFISDDPDAIEVDVIKLLKDDKFIVDLNVAVLAYVIVSEFKPEVTTFIHALKGLNFTAQEFAIIMVHTGSSFQFLTEHKDIAIEKALEANFKDFSDLVQTKIESVINKYKHYVEQSEPTEYPEEPINKKSLSQDELANKLIDEYLKNNKKNKRDKDKNN